MYDTCDGDMFRFQILDNKLYVYHITARGAGWYPALLGPGHVAARGRVPYAMLLLLDVLRVFPGQIPDTDGVMQLGDFPCIPARNASRAGPPVPMFSYNVDAEHADLVLPDYAWYGHEYDYLMDPWGKPVMGWTRQKEVLAKKYGGVDLHDRLPQALWRGRTNDLLYPWRDARRREFVRCVKALAGSGRGDDALLLNVARDPIVMHDFADYRYQVHIETLACACGGRGRRWGWGETREHGRTPGQRRRDSPARPRLCFHAPARVRGRGPALL